MLCVHHLPFVVQPDSSTLFLFQHLLLYRYMGIPLFSFFPSLSLCALTLAQPGDSNVTNEKDFGSIYFHFGAFYRCNNFTSSTANANFAHDLISPGFRVAHSVNTTRKLSRLSLPQRAAFYQKFFCTVVSAAADRRNAMVRCVSRDWLVIRFMCFSKE